MSDGTGEKPGGRQAVEDLIRRQRESGVTPREAERRARESAIRSERKNPR